LGIHVVNHVPDDMLLPIRVRDRKHVIMFIHGCMITQTCEHDYTNMRTCDAT
jgi:hypothetical protein